MSAPPFLLTPALPRQRIERHRSPPLGKPRVKIGSEWLAAQIGSGPTSFLSEADDSNPSAPALVCPAIGANGKPDLSPFTWLAYEHEVDRLRAEVLETQVESIAFCKRTAHEAICRDVLQAIGGVHNLTDGWTAERLRAEQDVSQWHESLRHIADTLPHHWVVEFYRMHSRGVKPVTVFKILERLPADIREEEAAMRTQADMVAHAAHGGLSREEYEQQQSRIMANAIVLAQQMLGEKKGGK